MSIVMVIVMSITMPFSSASAGLTVPAVNEKATSRVDAFVFQTLYAKRYANFLSVTNAGYSFYAYSNNVPFMKDGALVVNTCAATLNIDMNDFTVLKALMVLKDFNADTDKNMELRYQCIMAMSALEYDDVMDSLMPFQAMLDSSKPADAVTAIWQLWTRSLDEKVENQKIKKGGEALIYSGNCDYYLIHFANDETNYECYFLEARAR